MAIACLVGDLLQLAYTGVPSCSQGLCAACPGPPSRCREGRATCHNPNPCSLATTGQTLSQNPLEAPTLPLLSCPERWQQPPSHLGSYVCPWPSRHSSQALRKCMRPAAARSGQLTPQHRAQRPSCCPGPRPSVPWLCLHPGCHLPSGLPVVTCGRCHAPCTGHVTQGTTTQEPGQLTPGHERWHWHPGVPAVPPSRSHCAGVWFPDSQASPPTCAVLLFGLRGTEHTGLLSASCFQHVVRPALTFATRTHHTAGTDGQTRLLVVQPAGASTGVNCWVTGMYNCDLTRSHHTSPKWTEQLVLPGVVGTAPALCPARGWPARRHPGSLLIQCQSLDDNSHDTT